MQQIALEMNPASMTVAPIGEVSKLKRGGGRKFMIPTGVQASCGMNEIQREKLPLKRNR